MAEMLALCLVLALCGRQLIRRGSSAGKPHLAACKGLACGGPDGGKRRARTRRSPCCGGLARRQLRGVSAGVSAVVKPGLSRLADRWLLRVRAVWPQVTQLTFRSHALLT